MRYLLFLVLLLIVPALADDEEGAAETRRRVVGIWTPSRGYYNYHFGTTNEAYDYHILTKVLPDGTWTASDGRSGHWAVEEEDIIIIEPRTLKERLYHLTFLGDEMVRKGPYNRDGRLTKANESWTYFEEIKPLASPSP